MRMRNFCFTIHHRQVYRNIKWDGIVASGHVRYLVWQEEIGLSETQPEHVQGYCELKDQVSMSTIKAMFNCTYMHIEKRKGTQKQAIEYCKKEESRREDGLVYEWGTPKHQGKSSIYISAMQAIKGGCNQGYIMEYHQEVWLKYHNAVQKSIAFYKECIVEEKVEESLTPWQEQVWYTMQEDIRTKNTRDILWVWDPLGCTGKSWFAGWLMDNQDAAYFTNARTCDIAYAWKRQEICVFDLCRTTEGRVNYAAIEQLKNGKAFSSKYHSGVKRRKHVCVLVLANWEPHYPAMSEDRWKVHS